MNPKQKQKYEVINHFRQLILNLCLNTFLLTRSLVTPRRTLLGKHKKTAELFPLKSLMNEKIKNDEKFFRRRVVGSAESWMERKGAKMRKGEWNIKNWEPFMLNLFFMLGLPEIFLSRLGWAVVMAEISLPGFCPKLLSSFGPFFSRRFFSKKENTLGVFIT